MATAASGAPKANPPLTGSELLRGCLVALGVIACDAWLKAVALVGGCGPPRLFDADLMTELWATPDCPGSPMAGPSIVLLAAPRAGTMFGMAELEGVTGQLWGLALVAAATVTTIVMVRWRWRSGSDPLALGALWGGILAHAAPRLFGDGTTITSIRMFGVGVALGDVVVLWAIVWIGWRVVAEFRA